MGRQRFLNNFDTQFIAAVKSAPQTGSPATELDYGVIRVSTGAAGALANPTGGDFYILTGYKRAGTVESNVEIMYVTAVDTSVVNETRLTVARAQEGTTAQSYVAGDYLSMRLTASGLVGMLQVSDLSSANPAPPGAAAAGTSTAPSRSDHVHAPPTPGQIGAESSIAAASSTPFAKYWRGDKSWQDFATDVRGVLLTGLSTVSNAAVAATDSVLVAIGKLQAQLANYVPLAGGVSMTGTLVVKALQETKVAMAANNIDLSAGNAFSKTISGATTLTVSNVPAAGTVAAFTLNLSNGGSATITWWSGVKWSAGASPLLSASGRDRLMFITEDGGTTWDGFIVGKGMA